MRLRSSVRPSRADGRQAALPISLQMKEQGPSVHVRRNPSLSAGHLPDALIRMWADVTNAGGAVGFVPPVTPEDIRATAEAAFARVGAGADDLAVAYDGERPVAFGFLVTNEFALARHWGTVKRLQRDPTAYGSGAGALVLAELEACALDRGLERVCLTVRGSTGRERFYTAHGYRIDARLPGRLRLAEGVTVDELHLSKVVNPGALDPGALEAGALEAETLDAETLDAGVPAGAAVEVTGRAAPGLRLPLEAPALLVQRLDPELPLPAYAHPGDAGLDLHAAEDVVLAPGQRAVVPTGIAIALPPGHVGLVHPRSGLAARHGVTIVNAPGTIDEGYRGQVQVILANSDLHVPVEIRRGERIAQLVVQPVVSVTVQEVSRLDTTGRGAGGFGSTGR